MAIAVLYGIFVGPMTTVNNLNLFINSIYLDIKTLSDTLLSFYHNYGLNYKHYTIYSTKTGL